VSNTLANSQTVLSYLEHPIGTIVIKEWSKTTENHLLLTLSVPPNTHTHAFYDMLSWIVFTLVLFTSTILPRPPVGSNYFSKISHRTYFMTKIIKIISCLPLTLQFHVSQHAAGTYATGSV